MVSHLNIFVWKWSKIAAQKKGCFFADFALQNMVETTLPDGLESSGRRVYRFWHISRRFWVFAFWMIFSVFQKNWVFGILDSPYCGICATIRIGQEMLCLPYAGFLSIYSRIGFLFINTYFSLIWEKINKIVKASSMLMKAKSKQYGGIIIVLSNTNWFSNYILCPGVLKKTFFCIVSTP